MNIQDAPFKKSNQNLDYNESSENKSIFNLFKSISQ